MSKRDDRPTTRTSRLARYGFCVAVAAAACGELPEGDATSPQVDTKQHAFRHQEPIWSTTNVCTEAEKTKIRRSLSILNRWIHQEPSAFVSCIADRWDHGPRDVGTETDMPYTGYAEYILSRMQENFPLQIGCKSDLTSNALGDSQILGKEAMDLSRAAMANDDISLAGTIAHEIAHTKGFHHYINVMEFSAAVNSQVDRCVQLLARGQKDPERSGYTDETRLATVGLEAAAYNPGDLEMDRNCPGVRLGGGFHTYPVPGGSGVVGIGTICKLKGNDTTEVWAPLVGRNTTPVQNLRCNVGEMLVGAYGLANVRVQVVGALCLPESSVAARTNVGLRQAGSVGLAGHAPLTWQRQCPAGMAVKGLKGRWNGTVNTLEVNCQSYAEPRTIEYSAPAGFGSIPFPARRASELAAGRSVVTHLVVEGNSSGVQRVAGVQALIVNNQVPGGPPLALNSFGLIKGHGQLFGSSAPLDPCPTGAAVVGLHVLTAWGNPGELHALGAVCAPVNDWVNGNQSTTTRLPARGIMNGQPGESLCPARSFLVGWHVVNTGAKITSMTPYCRQVR